MYATLVGGSGDAGADVPEASLAEVTSRQGLLFVQCRGICASSSEARRQIKGGAARLEEKITDPNREFASAAGWGKVLQLGKKTFRRWWPEPPDPLLGDPPRGNRRDGSFIRAKNNASGSS